MRINIDIASKRRGPAPCAGTLKMKSWAIAQLEADKRLPSPAELAKKFGVSKKTVIRHLGYIADAAGVDIDSLLEKPTKKQDGHHTQKQKLLTESTNLEEFHAHYNSAIESMRGMIVAMEADIQSQESFLNENEGGIV